MRRILNTRKTKNSPTKTKIGPSDFYTKKKQKISRTIHGFKQGILNTESYTNNFCEEKTEIKQKMDDQFFENRFKRAEY